MKRRYAIHVVCAVLGLAHGAVAADFDSDWHAISAAAALDLAGGTFEVSVTVGQVEAGTLTGGTLEWQGGFLAVTLPGPPTCDEDLNGDGLVNLSDLALILANFGLAGATPEQGDTNGDGVVDLTDLARILTRFGDTCP